MAKKKKKDDGLREFEIIYTRPGFSMDLTSSQRAIDKHDAVLKFKQLNPNTKVKDVKEVIKQPTPEIIFVSSTHENIKTDNVNVILGPVKGPLCESTTEELANINANSTLNFVKESVSNIIKETAPDWEWKNLKPAFTIHEKDPKEKDE